ncbi:nuclear transport factor 2 family protein [Gordonia caeni]|uniref:SnoaL-like domain-containing protein n=1 Tax=Gordonia caeni TaxID=1007097 RepID=A0ABP7NQT7_9ACTN
MSETVEIRLRRLEDRAAIEDLVLLYFHVMDERDLAGLSAVFTADAHLGSGDGVFDATGLAALEEIYRERFAVLGPTFHFSHGVLITPDPDDPDTATGVLTGHAELVRNGEPTLVALRYRDVYRRTPAGWRIADRVMSYFYYCSAEEYATVLVSAERNRAYARPGPADWPTVLRAESGGRAPDWLRALTAPTE